MGPRGHMEDSEDSRDRAVGRKTWWKGRLNSQWTGAGAMEAIVAASRRRLGGDVPFELVGEVAGASALAKAGHVEGGAAAARHVGVWWSERGGWDGVGGAVVDGTRRCRVVLKQARQASAIVFERRARGRNRELRLAVM